jgi:hypothetical protein
MSHQADRDEARESRSAALMSDIPLEAEIRVRFED